MARALSGILAAAAIGAAGCSSISADSTHAEGVDFSAYRSFAQASAPESGGGIPGYSSITADSIQREIASQLESKGLSEADRDSADLVVRFSVSGKPQTDVWGTGGYGWYGGGSVQTTHYIKGTLVIDIFDTSKKKLVWHGWASTALFSEGGSGKKVPEAVEKILSGFPPSS